LAGVHGLVECLTLETDVKGSIPAPGFLVDSLDSFLHLLITTSKEKIINSSHAIRVNTWQKSARIGE